MEDRSAVRRNLLDRLLSSVKQVQIHFGARQEIATETDLRVATLCSEWEAVLLHGMKKTKPKGLAGIGKSDNTANIWAVAKLSLSPEERQRFIRLSHVTTDVGRGRAWLRAAINERTLENYLHLVLADEDNLKVIYEPHAFLLDQECSTMLPVMAAGLGSIIFSIPIDIDYLNSTTHSVDVPVHAPTVAPPISSSHFPSSSQPTSSPAIFERMPPLRDDGDDEVVAVNAKETQKKKKRKKKSATTLSTTAQSDLPQHSVSSRSPSVSPAPPPLQSEPHPLEYEPHPPQEEDPYVRHSDEPRSQESEPRSLFDELQEVGAKPQDSISTSSSRLSLNSATEEGGGGGPLMFVALDNGGISAGSETEAAANATACVLSAMTSQQQGELGGTSVGYRTDVSGDGATLQEMRETLLTLVKSKDEIDEKNRKLERQLHEVEQSREQLLAELDHCQTELRNLQESHGTQQQALERENDLLREQLKKYVGMVQAHRKESSARSTEGAAQSALAAGSSPPREGETEAQQTPSSSRSRSPSVEQKLSEMAEMYGDLMELNGRLHKDIAGKDGVICKLVASLRSSGVKIPVPAQQLPPAALEPQILVDVWIPSVIKKGRGPDTHHVYQIFIRVKSEEWNVYRRYNEFREFHRQLQSYTLDVSSFSFPPKKAIGNKSSQVVEERRQRLQEYLRFVFKVCSTKPLTPKDKKAAKKKQLFQRPIIQATITKATLVSMFPFFKEDLHYDNGSTHLPPPRSPSYSGL